MSPRVFFYFTLSLDEFYFYLFFFSSFEVNEILLVFEVKEKNRYFYSECKKYAKNK